MSACLDLTPVPFLKDFKNGVPKGIRTPVTAVKGQCPRPLDDGDLELYSSHFSFSVVATSLVFGPVLDVHFLASLIAPSKNSIAMSDF
jgi:hypothetical protein